MHGFMMGIMALWGLAVIPQTVVRANAFDLARVQQ